MCTCYIPFINYASDVTCAGLDQLGIPQCISPQPTTAAAVPKFRSSMLPANTEYREYRVLCQRAAAVPLVWDWAGGFGVWVPWAAGEVIACACVCSCVSYWWFLSGINKARVFFCQYVAASHLTITTGRDFRTSNREYIDLLMKEQYSWWIPLYSGDLTACAAQSWLRSNKAFSFKTSSPSEGKSLISVGL